MIRENIIKVLKGQHIQIEKILHDIDIQMDGGKAFDCTYIHNQLNNFKKIIIEHINIEDKEFYPALLEKMERSDENTDEIQEFISRMDVILKYVYSFLEQYDSPEKIKSEHPDSFKAGYIRMMSRLEIRINVEELFVYNKWLKLKSLEN